jgi:hypothetical protein
MNPTCPMLCLLALASSSMAEPIAFTVSETAGLRRFAYPVTASLECASGILPSPEEATLTDEKGSEVPAQFTAMSRWPDGSVRGLDVDFSPSTGPLETLPFRLVTGQAPTQSLRAGLSVTESGDEILVASSAIRHRIRRDGKPLIASIAFGDNEFIGPDGIRTTLEPGALEIVKRGPFNVTLKLGSIQLEYVNTKSWVKIIQRAESERELAIDAHFHLSKLPLLWDFGLGSWLYGNMAKPAQAVTLRHSSDAWDILTTPGELFAMTPTFDGCGHLADMDRVAAFGIAGVAKDIETLLTSDGRVRITSSRPELTAFFHVVGQPIPVTAVTSPQAMVRPLLVKRLD